MVEEIVGLEDEEESLSVQSMVVPEDATDRQIEKHFDSGRLRVVQEKNDIFLSHVVDFIGGSSSGRVWGNLRPEYQRRLRWDRKKKSKLIESFIMNVPVPPVFLYEKELGKFEVMDGQQRLNAIAEFWKGEFKLDGLEIWKALNGRNYSELPPLIRRGLERAKISAITLMSDASNMEQDSLDLRAQVFERLNTGGERLNAQELRNSLFSGSFNDLLVEISKEPNFTEAWDIPSHLENTREDGTVSDALKKNTLYKRMSDVEIILRFFAFQDPDAISGSVRKMLDDTMKKNRYASANEIAEFRSQYMNTLQLCRDALGEEAFRLPSDDQDRIGRLSKPLYDAQMVAFYRLREDGQRIMDASAAVRDALRELSVVGSEDYELMVGRANTAATIKERIERVEEVVQGTI